ncbi:GtrA family protein [Methanobacterium aggregans]|uniref:GtrA family protein n=1 Tax=Methanobacterium aggregans TaxID=1615586 RepID=UPI001AE48986|nr:GtrA family protein [Methanobacterium aggregans]MBP2044841.1 putative flippase GtrA [Methanobacterium aggregans]
MKIQFETLLKESTDQTLIQFFRYTFVGGVAFLLDFGSLYYLTEYLGVYYLLSAAIAFILGLVANYILSITWVFDNHTLDNKVSEFGLFALIGIVGLGINEFIIWGFTANVQIYYMFSKIISAIIVLIWNFSARKYLLFK